MVRWVSMMLLMVVWSGYSFAAAYPDDVMGFWQIWNKKTNMPAAVIAVYPYKDKVYGRLVATYNSYGIMDDTIYKPKDRATGIVGHPPYSGLDIVWAEIRGGRYKGEIIDSINGKVYNAELWRQGENLILRGKWFIFGRNETWRPFPDEAFTDSFKKPDLSTFKPIIPKVIN